MPGYDQTRPLGGSGSELANAQDNEIAPGVYRHARGQYSDNPAGMGFSPGFTGQVRRRRYSAVTPFIIAAAAISFETPSGNFTTRPAGTLAASA